MPEETTPETAADARSDAAPSGLMGRRILALCLDWAIASAISAGFFNFNSMATLGVFAAMTLLLVMTLGATIGHRLCGLRIYRLADGGTPPRPLQALVRTVSLCLVIPAVVWGSDGRGMHDVWAGTFIGRWGIPTTA